MDSKNQVKSKQRVTDHGEVYTSEREVNAMLDLVKQETERIDARFLEPACGNGNFLAEVLRRKLTVVESMYKRNQLDFERYTILAISNIYGVDILEDNAQECRERLYDIFNQRYTKIYRESCKESCRNSVPDPINFLVLSLATKQQLWRYLTRSAKRNWNLLLNVHIKNLRITFRHMTRR